MAYRWAIAPKRMLGSVDENVTSIGLLNVSTLEVLSFTAHTENGVATGEFYHLDIPAGNYTLLINGVATDKPWFQNFQFPGQWSVAHDHASSTNSQHTVQELTYGENGETAVSGGFRYTLTTQVAYKAGSLAVYFNGMRLPNSDEYTSADFGFKELDPNTGTFYFYTMESISSLSPTSSIAMTMADYEIQL